tara:strand:- start:2746 stop:3039 length:294 start_codon:yes stop_codon:yes gene_type:complete
MISSIDLGKLAVIRWIDAKEIGIGWHEQEEIDETNCPTIISIGWITGLTKLEIKLSADISEDPKDTQAGRSQAIPLGCVFDVKFLGNKEDFNSHVYS